MIINLVFNWLRPLFFNFQSTARGTRKTQAILEERKKKKKKERRKEKKIEREKIKKERKKGVRKKISKRRKEEKSSKKPKEDELYSFLPFPVLNLAQALYTWANKVPFICSNPDRFTSYGSKTCSNKGYFICSFVRGFKDRHFYNLGRQNLM